MLIETRLRKLEEHLAVEIDAQERERVRAEIRRMIYATAADPAADEAVREIADAQADYGHNDPRTRAIMKRNWPVVAAAMERYDRA